MEAGARARAAKLMSEKRMKTDVPMVHCVLRHGRDRPSNDKLVIPLACKFCPTFMPMDPTTPMSTPTTKPRPDEMSEHLGGSAAADMAGAPKGCLPANFLSSPLQSNFSPKCCALADRP